MVLKKNDSTSVEKTLILIAKNRRYTLNPLK